MEQLSFDAFTRKIYLRAPMDRIYRQWATESGICSWFLREARFTDPEGNRRPAGQPVAEGDLYAWKWHNFDVEETGRITAANGADLLEFTFAGEQKVSVNLSNEGDAVLLTLRQFLIPTDDRSKLNYHFGCSNGWSFWLANLKAWLEHGIVLNETGKDLRGDPMAGFDFVNI